MSKQYRQLSTGLDQRPLPFLMEKVRTWRESAQTEAWWQHEEKHYEWWDTLQDLSKEIVIWLTDHRRQEDALRLDAAFSELGEAVLEFREESGRSSFVFDPSVPGRPVELNERLNLLLDKASAVEAICDELNADVPPEVWKDFPR